HYCTTNPDELIKELDKLIWHQDEPFPTLSIFAQWNVMRLAREKGVTVLLDGQGGDESLAGYRKYYAFYLKQLLAEKKIFRFAKQIFYLVKNREFNFFNKEGIRRYLGIKTNVDYLSAAAKKLGKEASIGLSSAKTMRGKSKEDIEKYSFPA